MGSLLHREIFFPLKSRSLKWRSVCKLVKLHSKSKPDLVTDISWKKAICLLEYKMFTKCYSVKGVEIGQLSSLLTPAPT